MHSLKSKKEREREETWSNIIWCSFFMIIYLFLVCHSFNGIICCKIYFRRLRISRNVCISSSFQLFDYNGFCSIVISLVFRIFLFIFNIRPVYSVLVSSLAFYFFGLLCIGENSPVPIIISSNFKFFFSHR